MILPTKHIKISESLFGLGACLLKQIASEPKTVDELWSKLDKINLIELNKAYHGFDNMVLALDYLFIIGAININSEGEIYNAITTIKGE